MLAQELTIDDDRERGSMSYNADASHALTTLGGLSVVTRTLQATFLVESQVVSVPGWQRMSVREGLREPRGPVEGVPANLNQHLHAWVERTLSNMVYRHGEDFTRAVVLEFDIGGTAARNDLERISIACDRDEMVFIEIVDMVLHFAGTYQNEGEVTDLGEILMFGRSVYRLNDTRSGLERSVTAEEKAAVRLATQPADTASSELSKAWSALYGTQPDASAAWRAAITAVEALLAPITSPDDKKPTLGKSIPELESKKAERFSFRLDTTSNAVSSVETLAAVLRLMVNNPDRHGAGQRRAPTIDEATNVVQLAVTVVGWLRSGALTRVEP